MKQPKKKPTSIKPAAELPEWAINTPCELSYVLMMDNDADGVHPEPLEKLWLKRAEYVALKVQLAKLRGIAAPTTLSDDSNPAMLIGEDRHYDVPAEVQNAA